jgi:hypothetical protein
MKKDIEKTVCFKTTESPGRSDGQILSEVQALHQLMENVIKQMLLNQGLYYRGRWV